MLPPGNDSSSSGWSVLVGGVSGSGSGSGPEAVIVPLVFGLIFVVGLVGNSLVLVVIGRVRSVRAGGGGGGGGGGGTRARGSSATNIFIVNLSAADLSFLLFCVPFQATIYSLPDWVFGAFLCSFAHFFSSVSMLVSVFTLVAMSVDRYIAVVRARKAACVRSRRNALAGVCVIWTLSVLCSVPVAQHQHLTSHPAAPNSSFCWERWSGASRRAYRVSVLLLGYLLPLLLISCCYCKVLFHLHKKMKNMSKRSERSKRKVALMKARQETIHRKAMVMKVRVMMTTSPGSSFIPGRCSASTNESAEVFCPAQLFIRGHSHGSHALSCCSVIG